MLWAFLRCEVLLFVVVDFSGGGGGVESSITFEIE